MSSEQFGDFLNQTITFAQSVVVPVLGLAWAWWQNQNHKIVAAAASNPSVAAVVMTTSAAASTGPLGPIAKVIGPGEQPPK